MLKLIISDIDGCLTGGVGAILDWQVLGYIQKLNLQAASDPAIPKITVCSGRQQPYVESIMQAVGCSLPGIFENGAGLFFLDELRIDWSDKITPDLRQQVEIADKEILPSFIKKYNLYREIGKEIGIGILGNDREVLRQVTNELQPILAEKCPDLVALFVNVAIDIHPKVINKAEGVRKLADYCQIPLENIAGIGDSAGDLCFLEIIGFPFAVQNSNDEVKAIAKWVADQPSAQGVKQILERCLLSETY